MRRIAVLLVGAVVCTALAAPVPKGPERKLGPEWVQEKDGKDYIRKQEVSAVAVGGPSGTLWYSLPLEDHRRDLIMTEKWDFRGKTFTIRMPGQANLPDKKKDEKPWTIALDDTALGFERTEGKDGKAVKHDLKLGKYRYFDLDGDGAFDLMADTRGEDMDRWYIFLSDKDQRQLVRVGDASRNLNSIPVTTRGFDSETPYTFDQGKWRVETVEDRRLQQGGGKEKDKDK